MLVKKKPDKTGHSKPDVRNPDVFMSGSPNRTSGFRTSTVYSECQKSELVWISDSSVTSHFQKVWILDSV